MPFTYMYQNKIMTCPLLLKPCKWKALPTCSVKIVLLSSIIIVVVMQAIISTEGDQIVAKSDQSQCQSDHDVPYSPPPNTMTSRQQYGHLVSPTVLVIDEQN